MKAVGVQKLLKRSQLLLVTPCFTSSDVGILILAGVPRDGGRVLLEHGGQEFSPAIALRISESTAAACGLALAVLPTVPSSHLLSSPSGHLAGLLFSLLCVERLLMKLCTGWNAFLRVAFNGVH